MDIKELHKKILEYQENGYTEQVTRAVKRARGETREYIERTHPQVAFGGKSLIIDRYNNRTHHQTILGKFSIVSKTYEATIYSNYFQKWYATGAKQHPIAYGSRKGVKSTYYDPRGDYYGSNQNAIRQYFVNALERALNDFIKI